MSQLATNRGSQLVLSGSRTLDDGARGTLLALPGVFRLDVQVREDDLRVGLRNLSAWPLGERSLDPERREDTAGECLGLELRPSRHDVSFRLGPVAGDIVIAVMRERGQGRTTFTAQALIDAGE